MDHMWFLVMSSCWFSFLIHYALIIWIVVYCKRRRIHWIEFHEQTWCPLFFREVMTNCMQGYWCLFGLPYFIGSPAQTAANIIHQCQRNITIKSNYLHKYRLNMLDLCSGGSGPIPVIAAQLMDTICEMNIVLTDLFPRCDQWSSIASRNNNIKYSIASIDATEVDMNEIIALHLDGKVDSKVQDIYLCTMFDSMHHFEAQQLVSILADVIECNHEFMAIEIAYGGSIFHSILSVFITVMLTPLFVMYVVKCYLIERNELNVWKKIFKACLTVITVPIWITMLANDRIVSNGRCYTERELLNITESAARKVNKDYFDYKWECWTQNANMIFPCGLICPITVLYGYPEKYGYQKTL
eukprot:88691_1